MKIYDVIRELENDNSKLFMIRDFSSWYTEYETQLHFPIIAMAGGKVCWYNNSDAVKLGYAVLNCEFDEVSGYNKFTKTCKNISMCD